MLEGKDFVVPHPRHLRKDIQQQEIRDLEVDPALYLAEDYHPELLTEWPIDGDLVMPAEKIPELMKKGMDQAARDKAKAHKAHGLDTN